ncbi:aquaporin [Pseudoduganella sp. LjRoot289]|uniref:aquaporin n=1 Tax=Pseudoduganella sp. LjRoot289 TaxID=3342314 RepID=UPI003ECE790D
MGIARRLAAEGLGTAMLLAISCGSGFAAARLAGGDPALALLVSSVVSSTGLAVLILSLGPVSGGLFNPVLTLSEAWRGKLALDHAAPYIAAQLAGAFAGTAVAHAMFGLPLLAAATQARAGPALWLGEGVATFGLLAVFIGCGRSRPAAAPFAVAAYVMTACWFSPSAAFMNPAMTLARVVGSGAGGICLADAPAYILAQLAGAAAASALFSWMHAGALRRAG